MPGTHLLGESWVVRDGRVTTVVSQPHVWEMTLFTMAALEAWGPTDITGAVPAAAARASAPSRARPGPSEPLPATGGGRAALVAEALLAVGLGGFKMLGRTRP